MKKHIRLIAEFIVVVSIASLCFALAQAVASGAVPRLAHESTGEIFVPTGYGHGNSGTCAKVAVDGEYEYVLTAGHVLVDRGQLLPNATVTYKSGYKTSGRVVWFSDPETGLDTAIIRCQKTPTKFFPMSTKLDGQLYAEGKAQGTRTLSAIRYSGNDLILTGQSWHGDSGGPLRNSRGYVVGLVTAYDDDKNTVATPTSYIWMRARTPLRKILSLGCAQDLYRPIGTMPIIQGQCPPGGCPPGMMIQPARPAVPPQQVPPYEGGGLGPGVDPGPQPPDATPEPPPTEPTAVDIDALAAAVVAKMPPGPQGEKGEKGDKGDKGDPGQITPEQIQQIVTNVVDKLPEPDIDRITAEVIARMPSIPVEHWEEYVDKDGNPKRRLVESESYPFPGPIKLKFYRVDIEEIARQVAEQAK